MNQALLNGLVNGLLISLLGTAFLLVYSGTRVFFLGLAAVYTLVPFVTHVLASGGWPLPLAVLAGLAAGTTLSVACEVVNHWPLETRGASWTAHLISSLGIYLAVVQVVILFWGTSVRVLRPGDETVWRPYGLVVTGTQLGSAVTAVCVLVGLSVWLRWTALGLRIRALADNPSELALRGHNVRRLRAIVFGIGGLLAAVSGLATVWDQGFEPNIGLGPLFLAYAAVVVGGKETFLGPILGGVLLGVLRSGTTYSLSARWQEAVTFACLALFLLFQPEGILGRRVRLEASV